MSAIWPYRCTGMIAFVFGVIAAAMASPVELQRRRVDVDEHRPRAEPRTTQPAVAKNE